MNIQQYLDTSVNIIIAEDDDIDARTIVRAFKKENITNSIYRASDGVEALDLLKGTNGREKIPCPLLLLIDINMPRMDGIKFIKEIRKDHMLMNSTIFILSGSKSESEKIEAYDLGVDGFIIKERIGKDFKNLTKLIGQYYHNLDARRRKGLSA